MVSREQPTLGHDVTAAKADALIRSLFPSEIAVVELVQPATTISLLFDAEREAIAGATDRRVRDFASGRRCAHQALAMLGAAPAPLLPGPSRDPQWPPGFVGSITHCRGYSGAAVASTAILDSIGIDAEVHQPLDEGVVALVATDDERRVLRGLPDAGIRWECVLFSAKEAVYKAWHPLMRRWLGFDDVAVEIFPAGGTFTATRRGGGNQRLIRFNGRFTVADGIVATAVMVTAV